MPEMITKAQECGFRAAFTVVPKKTTKATDSWRLPRFVIHGTDLKTFDRAIKFSPLNQPLLPSVSSAGDSAGPIAMLPPPQPVFPEANSSIKDLYPTISISFEKEPYIPQQMEMRVAGFGQVKPTYYEQDKSLKWIPSRPLRISPTLIQVRWKRPNSSSWEVATWQFNVELEKKDFIPTNIIK